MNIEIGQTASLSKTITDADVRAFAELSGDTNPVHLDDEFARHTRFGRRIAHGMLAASLMSAVLGLKVPGPGAIYLHQDLDFRRPVYIDDHLTAVVEVTQVRADKPIITLATKCYNQNDEVVLEGTAIVLVEQAE